MMEDTRTLLFYLLSLAGLIIIAILFTGRIEPPETEPTVKPTARPAEVAQEGCPTLSQIIFYVPDLTTMEDNRLLISGTVYASDFVTPLAGALIKVWPAIPEKQYDPRLPPYLFRGQIRTDAAGHYQFTTLKPDHYDIIYFYYQVRYQNYCPLAMKLFVVVESAQGDVLQDSLTFTELGLMPAEPAGPLLRGSVDLVLPIPPVEETTTTN